MGLRHIEITYSAIGSQAMFGAMDYIVMYLKWYGFEKSFGACIGYSGE